MTKGKERFKMKKKLKGQIALNAVFIVICAMIIIPFVLLVSISLSNEKDIALNGYALIPRKIDLSAYKYVFRNPMQILNAYKVTIAFSVLSTIFFVIMNALVAFPLSRREFKYKKIVTYYFYFTTLIGGGMVPTYILYTQYLHLYNNFWVYILPGLIAPFTIFMIRTFFQDLPYEMFESAKIDGASEYRIFISFVLPLSKPVLATVALTHFLGKWNDWMTALLYIEDQKLISLQYLLQRIMQNIELLRNASETNLIMDISEGKEIPGETARMAMAVIAAGPALFIFPFFQKYFVKGLTVGSVKG